MTNTMVNGKATMNFQLWRINKGKWERVCMLESNKQACDNNELVLPRGVRL
jgi:hypothetical protein